MTQPPSDPKSVFLRNLKSRIYRVLNYITLFLYVAVISIAALITDYAIASVVEYMIAPTVSIYPIVRHWFDWFRIGSAILALIGAFVHALFSALSQIKLEIESKNESEKKYE